MQRIRHELLRRDVVVRHMEPVSPHLVAVTFAGETLASFVSASFDDHVKFMFTDTNGEQVRATTHRSAMTPRVVN